MALTAPKLFEFIHGDLDVEDDIEVDSLIFSTSVIDSFQMMTLIEFIEKECGFRIPPTEVTLENLDSVAKILAYAARRSGA